MWDVPEVENMPGGSTGSEEEKLKLVSEGCNTSTVSYLQSSPELHQCFPLFCVLYFYVCTNVSVNELFRCGLITILVLSFCF